MNRLVFKFASVCFCLFVLFPLEIYARVKLVTMPVRERVEIKLDNEDATLVEEERMVPLVATPQGTEPNQIDFSWANTQIDPDTIVFRILEDENGNGPETEVLSVSYPPGEPSLVWQVASSESGSVRVRISYIIRNLTKEFCYRAVASSDESELTLYKYVRIRNLSNEEFFAGEENGAEISAGTGREMFRPVGLNETKELLIEKFEKMPVVKSYTCSVAEYGYIDRAKNKLKVPMHYVIENAKESNAGTGAFPSGKVRVFVEPDKSKGDSGTSTFLGEDWGAFVPVGDEMRLYLGVAQDISVVRKLDSIEKKKISGNLFEYKVVVKYEIENFKDEPIDLSIRERLAELRGEAGFGSARPVHVTVQPETDLGMPDKKNTSADMLAYTVRLPERDPEKGAEKKVFKLCLLFNNEW